jgi:hypothetical protein
MLDVDVWSLWNQGRTEFTVWFTAASVVGNFWVVRRLTHLPLGKSIVADVAMTGFSWLFVATIPIPLYAYAIVLQLLLGGRSDPISWIIPVLLSVVTGVLLSTVVLVVCKRKVTLSVLLAARRREPDLRRDWGLSNGRLRVHSSV